MASESPRAMTELRRTSWWGRLLRVARFERGVFAEIGADSRATWQGLGIVLAASLTGGWRFLWPGDGEWHVANWLLEEGGVALASTLVASALLWTVARLGGGRGSMLALWRGIAFAIAPIVLGVFGFGAQLVGAALSLPLYVRAVAETQRVRTRVAIAAVATPLCSMPPSSPSSSSSSTGTDSAVTRRVGSALAPSEARNGGHLYADARIRPRAILEVGEFPGTRRRDSEEATRVLRAPWPSSMEWQRLVPRLPDEGVDPNFRPAVSHEIAEYRAQVAAFDRVLPLDRADLPGQVYRDAVHLKCVVVHAVGVNAIDVGDRGFIGVDAREVLAIAKLKRVVPVPVLLVIVIPGIADHILEVLLRDNRRARD